MPRLPVILGLLYVICCWGLNTVLVKIAIGYLNPLAFLSLRFLVMPPLAILLVWLAGERIHIEKRDLPLLILCSACGYGLYQYCWVVGLANTSAFASALLGSFAPLFTLAIVAISGHERVRGGRWSGAVVALVGIAIFEGLFSGRATFRVGDALTLLGAAIFAIYNVVSARLLGRYTPLSLLAITMCIGAVMIVPSGIPAIVHTDFARVPWQTWAIFAYAVFFPIVLTYPVWSWGITKIGAARVSLFSYLTPVVAGLISIPLLGAHIGGYQLLGAALCLGGMIVANLLGNVSLWTSRTLGVER
ncbi:MAG TPA: DMT family transporter [Verrucomicrobiae bacterium]|nr:DMT family transporter [Verrucomicrobiae bacterium]